MKYAVVIEKGSRSYGAYVPDLPGCVAVGESREEVVNLIREAIELHLEGIHESGHTLPQPASSVEVVEVTPGPPARPAEPGFSDRG
jgi:predicted RNase H-like HicB family nuclease